jgi:hypothetical protein
VRVARNNSAKIAILRGEVKTRARFKLTNVRSVEFLPGRVITQFGLLQRSPPAGYLLIADQYVHAPAAEVYPDAVSVFEDREVTAHG